MQTTIGLTLDSILTEAHKELTSQNFRTRFRLPLTAQQVAKELQAAYSGGVSYRGGTYLNDTSTLAKIEKVSGWLTSTTMKPMLLLCGSKGTGKTEMARSICKVINTLGDKARKLEHEKGSRATTCQDNKENAAMFDRLVRLPKPMLITAQQLAAMAKEENPDYGKARRSAILVVDDLGAEPASIKVYGSDQYPLIDLITERYDYMSSTIFTTNLNPEAISSYYGERIADRLNEVCERIMYQGDSYRK